MVQTMMKVNIQKNTCLCLWMLQQKIRILIIQNPTLDHKMTGRKLREMILAPRLNLDNLKIVLVILVLV